MKKLFKFVCFIFILVVIGGACYLFFFKPDNIDNSIPSYVENESSFTGTYDYIDYINQNQDNKVYYYVAKLYNVFEASIDDMKAGDNTIRLSDFPQYFSSSDINNMKNYIAVASSGALTSLIYDNPELFYISFEGMSIYTTQFAGVVTDIEFRVDDNFYENTFSSEAQIDNCLQQLRNARDQIINDMPEGLNDYQKVQYVNDYLVDNVEYDITTEQPLVHTAYGALVNGLAVCDGYSYAVDYLLEGLGIGSVVGAGAIITETKAEGHMWNYVELYGNWYGLDVTWNDPVDYISNYTDYRYNYFLIGGDYQSHQGFYSNGRNIANYIYSFGEYYCALPVPKIMKEDFVFPEIKNITMNEEVNGEEVSNVTFNFDVLGLVDNNYICYAISTDGGSSFGEYIKIENDEFSIVDPSQNGLYKFAIQSSNGDILIEFDQTYNVVIA